MSAYTEQYETDLRTAERALRDETAQRARWLRIFISLWALPVPFGALSVWMFWLEHLTPYTAEESKKIAAGGTVGVHFFGGLGVVAAIGFAAAVVLAGGMTAEKKDLVPTSAELRALADKVEDIQRDLDQAAQREQEEAIRQYTADTRTYFPR